MDRVEQIATMLPDIPQGLGDPYRERTTWSQLKASGHYDRIIRLADRYLDTPFPEFDEALYMRMFTHGDSQSGKDMQFGRARWLTTLTWAECLTNEGKYVPKIEEVIKGLISQKTWVNPRNYLERNHKGLVELSAARFAQSLAQAVYLLDDKLSPSTIAGVKEEINSRVLMPILATINGQNNDHGWLTATNNWNAVCLAGITIAALTVLEEKKERAQYVAIAERYHKNFIAGFSDDGYCSEGIGYYNYGFGRFIALREIVWQSTQGQLDFFGHPKMKKIAAFGIRTEIINDAFPAIADCKAGTRPAGPIVWYAARNLGIFMPQYGDQPPPGDAADLATDIMYAFPNTASMKTEAGAEADTDLALRSFFDVAGILIVRPGTLGGPGLGAALKGGNNAEHHNHNDVGSYTIAVGKEVVTGDPGLIPYTAKTFGQERYTYKSLGSYGHPVPLVAGKEQIRGAKAKATILRQEFTLRKDIFALDLSSCYQVPGLKKLAREFTYERKGPGSLEVLDTFEFTEPFDFETAWITRSSVKEILPDQWLLEFNGEKLVVKLDSFGLPYQVLVEQISEGGEPYSRIAVKIDGPRKSGRIKLTYQIP